MGFIDKNGAYGGEWGSLTGMGCIDGSGVHGDEWGSLIRMGFIDPNWDLMG